MSITAWGLTAGLCRLSTGTNWLESTNGSSISCSFLMTVPDPCCAAAFRVQILLRYVLGGVTITISPTLLSWALINYPSVNLHQLYTIDTNRYWFKVIYLVLLDLHAVSPLSRWSFYLFIELRRETIHPAMVSRGVSNSTFSPLFLDQTPISLISHGRTSLNP